MRDRLIKAGVRNLREFGYGAADEHNILTVPIFAAFFKGMLEDNLGKGADKEIKQLISECEKVKL